jgi:hypothetical protein
MKITIQLCFKPLFLVNLWNWNSFNWIFLSLNFSRYSHSIIDRRFIKYIIISYFSWIHFYLFCNLFISNNYKTIFVRTWCIFLIAKLWLDFLYIERICHCKCIILWFGFYWLLISIFWWYKSCYDILILLECFKNPFDFLELFDNFRRI